MGKTPRCKQRACSELKRFTRKYISCCYMYVPCPLVFTHYTRLTYKPIWPTLLSLLTMFIPIQVSGELSLLSMTATGHELTESEKEYIVTIAWELTYFSYSSSLDVITLQYFKLHQRSSVFKKKKHCMKALFLMSTKVRCMCCKCKHC